MRHVVDRHGVAWEVWEVHPTMAERRELRDRRGRARAGADRRVQPQRRAAMPRELQNGWLAFRSKVEHRRRAPIPADWESLDDAELLDVLERAKRSSGPRRLIE